MLRADQCWQSLRCFERRISPTLEENEYVLSSDLKSATDAIPHAVCRWLVNGFTEGYGDPKWDFLIPLIRERSVLCEDGSIHTLQRGVMMGEPLSKICLVLLGLVTEEIAFSDYTGQSLTRLNTVTTPWRCYHLGGDDHLATGPKGYLRSITALHKQLGSIISKPKHRMSKLLVVYTEKVLFFRDRTLNKSVCDVQRNPEDSIFVDSLKLRLFSPFTKATDTQNDKNVAIGKVKGVTRTLQYISDIWLKRTAVERLRYKFRDFIKGLHHHTISAVCALPIPLGGLGLTWDKREYEHIPRPWKCAFAAILSEDVVGLTVRRALGSIFVNSNPRGVTVDAYCSTFADQVCDYPQMVDAKRLHEIEHEVPEGLSFQSKLSKLKEKGWYSTNDLTAFAERPYLFRKLMTGKEKGRYYRTEQVRKRIARTWTTLEGLVGNREDIVFDDINDVIKQCEKKIKSLFFVNVDSTITSYATVPREYNKPDNNDVWLHASFYEAPLRQVLTLGEPSMKVCLSKN